MTRPFFLITNDDGIHAPGLKLLWESVADWADVAIVAPAAEKSGSGLSITWTKPLRIHSVSWEKETKAWSLTGTPADCVKMALSVLLEKKPNLILSGINRGSNAGRTVLYSGTVGGIIEGTLRGVPGIAYSFSDMQPPSLSMVKPHIETVTQYWLRHSLPPGTLLNVNFPLEAEKGVRGIRMAKQGIGYWTEAPEKRLHPEGIPYYWLGGRWTPAREEDPESDVALLEQNYITIAPVHVSELTDHSLLEEHKQPFDPFFEKSSSLV